MISKNKVMLLTGVINFLYRNADLVNHELRINHVLKPCTNLLCRPEAVVKLSLIKNGKLFSAKVWSLEWYDGFKDYIELPDVLCNKITQGRLARERAEQEAKNAEQERQATLFHANSGARS